MAVYASIGVVVAIVVAAVLLLVVPPKKVVHRAVICPNPNCGHSGEPRAEPRGNMLIAVLLFIMFALPGLLYLVLMTGYRYYCPRCGMQIATHA